MLVGFGFKEPGCVEPPGTGLAEPGLGVGFVPGFVVVPGDEPPVVGLGGGLPAGMFGLPPPGVGTGGTAPGEAPPPGGGLVLDGAPWG
jgi:hypothetical protein